MVCAPAVVKVYVFSHVSVLWLWHDFPPVGCWLGFEELFEDERDVVVPGEQLRHAPPFAARDDLCGPRGLWAHATGQTLNTHYIFV